VPGFPAGALKQRPERGATPETSRRSTGPACSVEHCAELPSVDAGEDLAVESTPMRALSQYSLSFALVALGGAGCTELAGTDECGGCEGGYVCVTNRCLPVCATDRDCPDGLVCDDSVCVRVVTGQCVEDQHCVDAPVCHAIIGATCVDGSCTYPAIPNCVPSCDDITCDDQQGGCARDGVCIPGTETAVCDYVHEADGTACELPNGFGSCEDGICQACSQNGDCARLAGTHEDCMIGVCANGRCQFEFQPGDTVCGGLCADGACDEAGHCVGDFIECTTSEPCLEPSGSCNPDTGGCEFQPRDSGYPCRPSAGPCDVAETCDGVRGSCPADVLLTSGQCRAAPGECDVAESCDGSGPDCPVDGFAASTVLCRAAPGDCDVPEYCSGVGPSCPSDVLLGTSDVCRWSTGDCDPGEVCTGSSTTCPADRYYDSGVPCRGSAGQCDLVETCTGGSPDCPADTFDVGAECRGSAGTCDVIEYCGEGPDCPADAFSSAACRGAANDCDPVEYCPGGSAACPDDISGTLGGICCDEYGSCWCGPAEYCFSGTCCL
jgi:hypothetical protein